MTVVILHLAHHCLGRTTTYTIFRRMRLMSLVTSHSVSFSLLSVGKGVAIIAITERTSHGCFDWSLPYVLATINVNLFCRPLNQGSDSKDGVKI